MLKKTTGAARPAPPPAAALAESRFRFTFDLGLGAGAAAAGLFSTNFFAGDSGEDLGAAFAACAPLLLLLPVIQ
ncbi:MAG: hypothetical protein MK041_10845, partial [Aquabacterium sp.]|nr:hypothetical protein [Aquabacterium sp.]